MASAAGAAGHNPSLVFSPTFSHPKYHLLEVIPAVEAALAAGERLEIKAEGDEDAVVCTATQTFQLKTTDVSDSLYLIPPSEGSGDALAFSTDEPRRVEANIRCYFELALCPPRTAKLVNLLKERMYLHPDREAAAVAEDEMMGDGNPKGLYDMDSLEDRVQASKAEIRETLRRLNAFELNGYWRLVGDDYTQQVLHLIELTVTEKDIDVERVPTGVIVDELRPHDVEPEVARCVLRRFGTATDEAESHFELDPIRICRFRAEELLRAASNQAWDYDDFMASWQANAPEGITIGPDMLNGLALMATQHAGTLENPDAVRKTIVYYPVSALPQDPKERFARLFATRDVWTQQEILPYLKDLEAGNNTAERLLFKYARAFDRNGVKMYNAR